jgi:hypothetical protein
MRCTGSVALFIGAHASAADGVVDFVNLDLSEPEGHLWIAQLGRNISNLQQPVRLSSVDERGWERAQLGKSNVEMLRWYGRIRYILVIW